MVGSSVGVAAESAVMPTAMSWWHARATRRQRSSSLLDRFHDRLPAHLAAVATVNGAHLSSNFDCQAVIVSGPTSTTRSAPTSAAKEPAKRRSLSSSTHLSGRFPLVGRRFSERSQRSANVRERTGGAKGNRTLDLVIANDALYQLSYSPKGTRECSGGLPRSADRLFVRSAVSVRTSRRPNRRLPGDEGWRAGTRSRTVRGTTG